MSEGSTVRETSELNQAQEFHHDRWIPFVAGTLGLGLFFYPEFLSGFKRMQWDTGDTRLVNLVLEQSYRWVKGIFTGVSVSYWNPPYFFPATNVSGYTDLFLGEAPLYWLARALGLAMDTSMQVFMMLIAVANFVIAYFWLRRPLAFNRLGASAGAFLFAYGYPRAIQMGHPALMPAFPTLIALWGLWAVFAGGQRVAGSGASVAGTAVGVRTSGARQDFAILSIFAGIAWQLLTGFYLGWFLVLSLGFAILFGLIDRPRRNALFATLRRQWLFASVAACAAALVLAPMAIHYLDAAREVGLRPYAAVFAPRIQGWFYLGHESWIYGWQDLLKGFRIMSDLGPEQKIGIGWMTTVVVLFGWRRIWKETAPGSALRLLGGVSLVLFLMTTEFWPGVKLWRGIYETVPGARAIRALSRVGILFLIPEAVGLAAFVGGLRPLRSLELPVVRSQNRANLLTPLAVVAVLAILFLEQGHRAESFDKAELRDEAADITDALDPSCRFFFYSGNGQEPDYRYQVDAMWAAYQSGIPTLNGYSGNTPPAWHLGDSAIRTREDETRLAAGLADWMHEQGLDPSGLCWVRPDEGEGS